MSRTVSLIVAGVMTLGYGTAAFAQTHYDPTPEHIYYYGPAERTEAATPQASAITRKAHAQARHLTQARHAQGHGQAAPAPHSPAPQKAAPQG